MKWALVCVTAVLVVVAAAAPVDEQRRLWADQMARLRRVACGGPKERVVSLEELQVSPQSSEELFPHATVLHRCDDHSFCCAAGRSWGPVEVAAVQLVFHARDLVSSGAGFRVVAASNHTRCGCDGDADAAATAL